MLAKLIQIAWLAPQMSGAIQKFTDNSNETGTLVWDVKLEPKKIITLTGDLAITIINSINGGEYYLDEYQDVIGGHTLTITNTLVSGNNGGGSLIRVEDPNIKNKHMFIDNGIDLEVISGPAIN